MEASQAASQAKNFFSFGSSLKWGLGTCMPHWLIMGTEENKHMKCLWLLSLLKHDIYTSSFMNKAMWEGPSLVSMHQSFRV